MDTAEFLFPGALQVTPTKFRKILLVGSCLSEAYARQFREQHPETVIDHCLFNNASDLPQRTHDELREYDLQYIQLPLRSVLTDAVIRIVDNDQAEDPLNWIEIGRRNIDAMLAKVMAYNEVTGILSLVSNFIVPQGRISPSLDDHDQNDDLVMVVRELNRYLSHQVRNFTNAFIADVDMIANTLGKKYFLDDTIFFFTHGSVFYPDWSAHENDPAWTRPAPGRIEPVAELGKTYENHNDEFFKAVFRQIEALYRTVNQIDMVKIVIFDLDNTMWRGSLGDDYQHGKKWPYSDGWPLGIWEAVHHLRRRGIIVSLASKNDEHVVKERWADVVSPPFIRFDDFVAPRIDWNSKADNIKAILDQLSLTPRSAVLVDDNPVERESVKALLPGIRVLGRDPFRVRRHLLWSPETQIATRSAESKQREAMLKRQVTRESDKAKMSRQEFLASLQTSVEIRELSVIHSPAFARVIELVNKTNQFNTNGKRWTTEEFRSFMEDGGIIFYFTVRDRFADYGIVGVVFLCEKVILQIVMSCRVLGMDIELAVVNEIVRYGRAGTASDIHASVTPTEANMPGREVFSRSGFVDVGSNTYMLKANTDVAVPVHVRVHVVETLLRTEIRTE